MQSVNVRDISDRPMASPPSSSLKSMIMHRWKLSRFSDNNHDINKDGNLTVQRYGH